MKTWTNKQMGLVILGGMLSVVGALANIPSLTGIICGFGVIWLLESYNLV